MDKLLSLWAEDPAAILRLAFFTIGTILAIITLRKNTKSTQIGNLLSITQSHRDIWSKALEDEDLTAILSGDFDISDITRKQRMFINFIILHFASSFEAQKRGALIKAEQLRMDANSFFNLPAPNYIWKHQQKFQNSQFRNFVNDCIENGDKKTSLSLEAIRSFIKRKITPFPEGEYSIVKCSADGTKKWPVGEAYAQSSEAITCEVYPGQTVQGRFQIQHKK